MINLDKPSNTDNVNMRHTDHASLNYAKARYAIHEDAKIIANGNIARAHNWSKQAKQHVIAFLQGEVDWKEKIVTFPDGTKAKL